MNSSDTDGDVHFLWCCSWQWVWVLVSPSRPIILSTRFSGITSKHNGANIRTHPHYKILFCRTINGLTFPQLFQIPFILCKFSVLITIFPCVSQLTRKLIILVTRQIRLSIILTPWNIYWACSRSRGNGSRLQNRSWDDALYVLCCSIDDLVSAELLLQFVVPIGFDHFSSLYTSSWILVN